jgi:O-antigen ligase
MAAIHKTVATERPESLRPRIFVAAAALFFFVAVLKFGYPIVLESLITPPENASAAIFESWQIELGYLLMGPLIVAGLFAVPWKGLKFRWPLLLPAIWLGWQFIAAAYSISPRLSGMTVQHFAACVILFYLGCFAMKEARNPWLLWTALALALCWIIHIGFEQHFGGLEATRKMILNANPGAAPLDPAYLARVSGGRVFSTFSNPDALAGGLELLLPISLVFLWQITPKVHPVMRWAFVIILGGCGLACLYWSRSKAGWLVALVAGMIVLGYSNLSANWKRGLIWGVLILGLAGFGIRNAAFFHKEKNSVGARFTYWRAAIQIAREHPVTGTGPGTFGASYAKIKQPNDEMARLCHNDYLEQACDSGFLGFLAYLTMFVWVLIGLYRYRIREKLIGYDIHFAIGLGLLCLCLHSLVDYHLYMPALAWPMFFLMGYSIKFKD